MDLRNCCSSEVLDVIRVGTAGVETAGVEAGVEVGV